MNKIENKIYTIAMIELLINGNNQTDLGSHTLEYFVTFSKVGGDDLYRGDACLAVATRLKNKSTQSKEWGNIYYKRLIQNSSAYHAEARLKLKNMLNQILKSTVEEKIDFIFRPEHRFRKTPYLKSEFINAELSSFFENLRGSYVEDLFRYLPLNGKFPAKVVPNVDLIFNDIVTKNPKLSIDDKKIKR